MNEEIYMDPSISSGAAGAIGAFMWAIMLAIYVYFAFMQFKIASNKTGNADMAWFSFRPHLLSAVL